MTPQHTFRPGVLSTADAEALNRLLRAGRGLTDIQVRPPLSIIRGAFDSQPIIYMDQMSASAEINSYLLDVPCLVFSGGVAVGLAGVVVAGDGSSAECVVKGQCSGEDCGGGSVPPSPPPPVEATISGTVSRTGDGAGPVSGRAVSLLATGTTVTTDAGGNYSFSGVSGPSLRFVQLTLVSGETATNTVDGGGSVAGAVATVYVTTTTHDADFVISTETPSPPVPPSPPPPGPPPVPPPGSGGGE